MRMKAEGGLASAVIAATIAVALSCLVAGPFSPPAHAQDYAHISSLTTHELLKICAQDAKDNASVVGFTLSPCNAYILGVADQLSMEKAFCLSSPTYAAKVVEESKRFLRAHPEYGAQPPLILIRRTLATAYPCDVK
jgi:hypothetical protein